MANIVVDASILAAIVYQEPDADDAWGRIDPHALHAPHLVQYEMVSVAWKKSRRHPALRELIEDQWQSFHDLDIEYHEIDPTAVLHLALDTGLTTYDAAYLWLAESLECELATLDHQLEAVATDRR